MSGAKHAHVSSMKQLIRTMPLLSSGTQLWTFVWEQDDLFAPKLLFFSVFSQIV